MEPQNLQKFHPGSRVLLFYWFQYYAENHKVLIQSQKIPEVLAQSMKYCELPCKRKANSFAFTNRSSEGKQESLL